MTLTRSRDRIFGGVCGGIADWLGWSPTIVRILYVLVSIASAAFPGILVYIVLWMVMPSAGDTGRSEIKQGNFHELP